MTERYSLSTNALVIVPGRWEEVRQPTDTEIYEVGFIKMRIEAASAKRRDAGPGDYPSVSYRTNTSRTLRALSSLTNMLCRCLQDIANQELRNRVWTGVIPIEYAHGKPQPTEYNVVSAPKDYWNGGAPSL